jgi:VWFA-related protein
MRRLALIFSFSASLLCAQVIHVSVNLVQVDAVVTDSKGHHVSDLGPGDFEIIEDGKPQKITNFSWLEVPPPALAGRIPRKEDIRRSMVLLIDDGSIDAQGMQAATKAARGFVANQMAPGDLVAITSTRGGMGFYQQFTSDKPQLYAAIDRLSQRWAGLAVPFDIDMPAWTGLGTVHRDDRPAANPFGFLRWAIQGLQNTPGRKALVLLAHAFPAPPDLIDMANRAGVVIYVIVRKAWTTSTRIFRATPLIARWRRKPEGFGYGACPAPN